MCGRLQTIKAAPKKAEQMRTSQKEERAHKAHKEVEVPHNKDKRTQREESNDPAPKANEAATEKIKEPHKESQVQNNEETSQPEPQPEVVTEASKGTSGIEKTSGMATSPHLYLQLGE